MSGRVEVIINFNSLKINFHDWFEIVPRIEKLILLVGTHSWNEVESIWDFEINPNVAVIRRTNLVLIKRATFLCH